MKTKLEILEETILFYSTDPNRVAKAADDSCRYRTEDGRECAVGRCLIDSSRFFDINTTAHELLSDYTEQVLKPEYRGHDYTFWTCLQNLHDSFFWELNKPVSPELKEAILSSNPDLTSDLL